MPATGGAVARPEGPCDIYAAANTPCAAAYSTVRTLTKSYIGPLFQIRIGSSATNTGTGGTLKDIGQTSAGYADVAAVDASCSATTICTVSKLYDQSGNQTDMVRGTAGPAGNGTRSNQDDYEAVITKAPIKVGGKAAYALWIQQYGGYRTPLNVKGAKMPLGTSPEGIYMLADGTHSGGACCWDFGNVSTNPNQYHTMNTLFLGTGFWGKGAGSGPWFLADFEAGVWAGGSGASNWVNPNSPSMKVPFALGILKTKPGNYAIRMANVETATDLTTAWDGATPKPMDNQGGVVLGVGGDNSNNSEGTFYEGAITIGEPSTATDLAVMKNIQAVGYSK